MNRDGNLDPTRGYSARSGPTLMGRILPGSIKNRIGYGLKKKKPEAGPSFIKKTQKPDSDKARLYI